MANQRQIGHFVTAAVALALLILIAAVLAGCGDNPTNTPSPATTSPATTSASQTTTVPTTSVPTTLVVTSASATTAATTAATTGGTTSAAGNAVPDQIKPVFQAAANDLNKRNQIDVSSIQLTNYQSIDFPDSSLGCPQPNTMYSQVITPGYVLNLTANGQSYEYHSNRTGSHVVLCTGNMIKPVNP